MHELLGEAVYRLAQRLRREPMAQALDQLEKTQWLPIERLRELQREKLSRALKHAIANIPYYRSKASSLPGAKDIEADPIGALKIFPAITKKILSSNLEAFRDVHSKLPVSYDSTSGSSGFPMIMEIDYGTLAFQHAAFFRAAAWYGIRPGYKEVRLWGTQLDSKRKLQDSLKNALLNRTVISCYDMSDRGLDRIFQVIKKVRPTVLYGFTSAVATFCKYVRDARHPKEIDSLKCIFITGEKMLDSQKQTIREAFPIPLVNEYGCTEFGPLSMTCPHGSEHYTMENLFAEFDGDRHALLTDLNSRHMPLIRFENGDMFTLKPSNCPCGRALDLVESVAGRITEYLQLPSGKQVHGMVFDYIPKYFIDRIDRFQVAQTDLHRIEIRYVAGRNYSDRVLDEFRDKLRSVIDDDVNLVFLRTEQLEVEKSGKTKFVKGLPKTAAPSP
jgi:phenylacetate-CoA ligase